MALRPCPECGREISTQAAACPTCGYDVRAKRAARESSRRAVGCLVVLLGMATCYVVFGDPTGTGTPRSDPNLFNAKYACEQYIKPRLTSPSTAKFGDYGTTADAVTALPNGTYQVVGYVDAQNAFGGTLRKNYVCEVLIGGGRTRVTSLEMED